MVLSDKNKVDYKLLGRVFVMVKFYWMVFIIVVILVVFLVLILMVCFYLIKVMVDDYIFFNDILGFFKMVMILVGLLFLDLLCCYWFIYLINLFGQFVICDFWVKVFWYIIKFWLIYFDCMFIGILIMRMINDIEAINIVFLQGFIIIIVDLLMLVMVLGVMFYISWKLILICLMMMLFLILVSYIFKEKVKKFYQWVCLQIFVMNVFLQECILGMWIV